MLLAIQRAFTSMLPWSPLSFAIAISVALIPGATWAQAVLPGIVSSLLMAGTGWALDSMFRPTLSGPRPAPKPPQGSWASILPLLLLLAILVSSITLLHYVTDVRVVGMVILIVPLIAMAWIALQSRSAEPELRIARRFARYSFCELPNYRSEILLLMMAGYIGTVGAPLLEPLLTGLGLDLAALPMPLVLVAFVWLIPLAGQIGMNPILAVTLIAPLVPPAAGTRHFAHRPYRRHHRRLGAERRDLALYRNDAACWLLRPYQRAPRRTALERGLLPPDRHDPVGLGRDLRKPLTRSVAPPVTARPCTEPGGVLCRFHRAPC